MITPKQQRIFEFLREYIVTHKYAPTIAEITAHLGIQSRTTVHRHLQALAQAKMIRIIPGRRRNIELATFNWETHPVLPVHGKVISGEPIVHFKPNAALDLSPLLQDRQMLVFRLDDDGLRDEGYLHGDIILVDPQRKPHNGCQVLVLVDKQETLIRFWQKNPNGTITLSAHNPNIRPFTYPLNQLSVYGEIRGMIRMQQSDSDPS